ncbi:hypothetical protein PAI11_39400 [Patulibacter medicamentivorans]|uniref:Uncharacterized protein n=1 Tax=Patulibacter medicamentivorans TaxID=1097667 RepID=H0EAR6_9ACTN|nr:hypothetical protein PAI11_39400 [Patulibacter medicamentivorans]
MRRRSAVRRCRRRPDHPRGEEREQRPDENGREQDGGRADGHGRGASPRRRAPSIGTRPRTSFARTPRPGAPAVLAPERRKARRSGPFGE